MKKGFLYDELYIKVFKEKCDDNFVIYIFDLRNIYFKFGF